MPDSSPKLSDLEVRLSVPSRKSTGMDPWPILECRVCTNPGVIFFQCHFVSARSIADYTRVSHDVELVI